MEVESESGNISVICENFFKKKPVNVFGGEFIRNKETV
jgi:hypothetical protein